MCFLFEFGSLIIALSLPLFCDLCSQKTQHILCFVLLLLSVRVCRRLKTGRLLPTTYTECAHYNAVCGAMRIFGQHLLTFVSGINFDLPYAAAASAAALLPLFVSPLCAFSNDKFVSFALSLQHTHTDSCTHIQTLSHSLLCALCETISATLTCSLALPHTQHVLCSPALFARLLSLFSLFRTATPSFCYKSESH